MSELKRVGFFHFGCDEKGDPVGSLETKIAERPKSKLKDTLLVLPEAFNTIGGFYTTDVPPRLDQNAIHNLQRISSQRGIVLVAGIIDRIGGSNSAYLFDGPSDPKSLTSKATGSRDGLYAGCEAPAIPVNCRGIALAALVCDDAMYSSYGEAQQRILTGIKRFGTKHNILCIPACMTLTESLGTARRWGNTITVVLANGSRSKPSVIIHGGRPEIVPGQLDQNEIQLCDL